MTTTTFNFSVFSLAQLSSAGTGSHVGAGDVFTMPGSPAITMSVRDDDSTLSGDGRWSTDDHATDWSHQTASIISGGREIGNHGQVYAERVFTVRDEHGRSFRLIEIEQEGSSHKFYTFDASCGVPAAGARLHIVSEGDISGVNMRSLTANAPAPQPGEVVGRFFFDADHNGTEWNANTHSWEAGVGGQKVQLLNRAGHVVAETTTDAHGWYKFGAVVPGEYQVKFLPPQGFVFTAKDIGDIRADSDANAHGVTDFFHVASGQHVSEIDAGVKPEPKGEVSGRFFFDADHNGSEWNAKTCAWEKGVEGKIVQLLDKAGNVVAQTTTAHDGSYSFHVAAGEYRVKFPSLDGFDFTHKDVGDFRTDSDADATGLTDFFHVVAGQKLCDIDAGIKEEPQGHISGRLTFDADCNDNEWNEKTHSWDAGVDGQKVLLLDETGKVVAETTTDHYGNYKFTVPAGKYQVKFPLLDGYEFSRKDSGVDDHFDSDADATGLTDAIHLSAGQSIHNVDAGLKQCVVCPDDALKLDFEGLAKGTIVSDQFPGVTISSFTKTAVSIKVEAEHMEKHGFVKAHGVNASGCELVRLHDNTGKLATTFTGASGEYDVKIRVQDECDGRSTLKLLVNGVEVKSFRLANDNNGWGSDNGHFSTVVIQDVHIPAGARVELVAHRDGHEFVRVDKLTFVGSVTENRAMIFDTDHITGGDFDLKNGDGKVLIISEDGDSNDPDDNAAGGVIDFDFDAPTHVYAIDVIDTEEGGKIEAFDANGVKIGEVAIPKIADGAVRTVVLNFDNVSELVVTLNGSGALDNLCYKPKDQDPMTAALGDLVFFDANRNGLQDGGEAGVAGVAVELIDANGNVVATTVTDPNGAYLFEGLAAGDYRVRFANDVDNAATAIDETALVFTTPNAGDDALDSDADATGLTGVISLAEGQVNRTVDAGLVDPGTASIAGRVFHDSDDDSRDVNEAEQGAGGVRVVLRTAAGVLVAETTTAADGSYSFTGLDAGGYVVVFPTDVNGKVLVDANVGGDDAIDSDADQTTGRTETITLQIGENRRDVDAGVEDPGTASIAGRVFHDSDDDSRDVNEAEQGAGGVRVVLQTAAGALVAETTTAADGSYSFTGLDAGGYVVVFPTDVNGKVLVDANVGGDDAIDSDANQTTGRTETITLQIGENKRDVDAGVEDPGTASLGDTVFFDNDGNGVFELAAGDTVAEGVLVELLDANGVATGRTDTTDANGQYLFEGLDAGDYRVRFGTLAGFTFTTASSAAADAVDGDSDAGVGGLTGIVTLSIGEAERDVDAGLVDINDAPIAVNDMGKVCADEVLTLNLLANDRDPEGDALSVLSISDEDETAGVGETITLASGAKVTLNGDGSVRFDGIEAYKDLAIGQKAMAAFSYTVSDGELTDVGDVDLTICGAKNTLETIEQFGLPDTVLFSVSTTRQNYFTVSITSQTGGGDDAISLIGSFRQAFCADADDPSAFNTVLNAQVYVLGSAASKADGILEDPSGIGIANWILNGNFTGQYNEFEQQFAIWRALNIEPINLSPSTQDFFNFYGGSLAGAEALYQEALNAGAETYSVETDGIQPGEIIGVLLVPTASTLTAANEDALPQPYIIGVSAELLLQDCLCA
jgi:hypothetical protein